MGGFQAVKLPSAPAPWVQGASLGKPLHPEGLVRPAAVEQGGDQGLLLQVRLPGDFSFPVLLLRGAGLGPGLALTAGCRSDPDGALSLGVSGPRAPAGPHPPLSKGDGNGLPLGRLLGGTEAERGEARGGLNVLKGLQC